jgi:hypothetical protein
LTASCRSLLPPMTRTDDFLNPHAPLKTQAEQFCHA